MTTSDLIQANIKALAIFNANNTTMTVSDCARFLKVHTNTVKNRIYKGTIKATFQDGKYHIPKIQFLTSIIASFEADIKQAS